MQDPEIFLTDLGVHLSCAVEPKRSAVINSAYRVSVGYESYFFCDSAAIQKFRDDITLYCGILTDPVTLVRFQPNQSSPMSALLDRVYVFASDSSKQAFDMIPETYAWPNHQMISIDKTAMH